ncbi:MAG TPA: IS256 family transposase, partial [Candidatus Dormibacteraeota bacterium]|nr:IS256 family transposase [Candidatus Dormibacteraeota bacterium]
VLEELMLYERQCFLNAQPYQRQEGRVDQANGFYRRHLTTRAGTFELAVPRTRGGLFRSQVIPRYGRRDRAVDEAIKSVFLLGVSTRQTGRALAALLDEAVSAATVSAVCKVLDGAVARYHQRPLEDRYEYLLLDGVSVRLRLVGVVRRRMVLCAYGITAQGQRELIDFQIVHAEGEDTWKSFLLDLYRRGLTGQRLRLVVTDGQKGAAKAIAFAWPRARHQRCWAHKLRNVGARLKRSQQRCVDEARAIYQADTRQQAIQEFRIWKTRWREKAPDAVRCLENDLEALLEFMECPHQLRKKLRTTNAIERLFVEVRRRIRTMCAFTTRSSCERILFSVFDRMNTYWRSRPL